MSALDHLRAWARRLKLDVLTLWFAARDPATPLPAKLAAGAVAAYAFSPIDLIPDFIPVLGYLDDLILVPAGIWLVLRLLPPAPLAAARARAAVHLDQPVSRAGALGVVLVWLGCVLAAYALWR